MLYSKLTLLALALAANAAPAPRLAHYLDDRILVKRSSAAAPVPSAQGSYVAPASSAAPAASAPAASAPAASHVAPSASAPAAAPSSNAASYVAPSAIAPVASAPPPSTAPTTTTTSTTPPASTATWVIKVEVGSNTFYVGDADQNNFQGLMGDACNSNGCSPDSPENFKFNWTQSTGYALPATGTFTMSGNIDNDPDIENALLSAVNSALLSSSSCNTVNTEVNCHGGIGRRMVDPPITICDAVSMPQCTVVDYLQATLYNSNDGTSAEQMAQMTMNGASSNPGALICADILGGISDALGLLPLPGFVNGAVTIAEAFCGGS